jgi:hypothetical protein
VAESARLQWPKPSGHRDRRRAVLVRAGGDGGRGLVKDLAIEDPLVADQIVDPHRDRVTAAVVDLDPDLLTTHRCCPGGSDEGQGRKHRHPRQPLSARIPRVTGGQLHPILPCAMLAAVEDRALGRGR